MENFLIIFAGGGLGAVARFFVSNAMSSRFVSDLPFGTLFVNVSGSFLMGFILSLAHTAFLPAAWRPFAAVGFIGAFTTFSTYAYETVTLLQRKAYLPALWNFFLNNVLSCAAIVLGMLAATLVAGTFKGARP
jgi:CrcB protein